jgi:NAD-dependent DNA ligase
MTEVRLNEKFIMIMEQLAEIMLNNGETFKARAYQKAQETIMSYPSNINSHVDLKGKPGIGPTILEKLNEFVLTGTLEIIEREKNNPVNILTNVYGIGPKKAKELVDNGIITIQQLRENQQMINDVQKVGLKYYEDILKRIPRSEIEQYNKIFTDNFDNSISRFEIVGSYRRGAESSGDIDVIITSESPNIFVNFINELIKEKIIVEVLSRGTTKCLVIAKIPSSNVYRRVDFLYASPEEFPFAILYFTGSKFFNTVMRQHAVKMGLTMNEHGLHKIEGKIKVETVFTNEKDIFDFLNMEYKTPMERIDGRSVVEKSLSLTSRFKRDGISVLDSLNESQLSNIICHANKAYYNSEQLITDNEYDIIKEYIERKYPNNQIIREIGAPIDSSRKVTLPYYMGSMDKIKPDTESLTKWRLQYKGPYVLSCKLDGVSGLFTTEDSIPKLYTRGDGKVGQDVSHLIPYLRLPKTKGVVVRGEFIILKEVFENKYKNKFANPRNMVAGIINNKTVNEAINDLRFVAYEVIRPILPPCEQMKFLSTMDIECVFNKVEKSLTNEMLSQTLINWRSNYSYQIDGVIVVNNGLYERNIGNPEHSFAFKMVLLDQIAEAKVVDVIWNPSKYGYLKPRVQIEPIRLGGVCIEYATGFNGSFIYNNKVGIGSIIELIRSGDVIPHIRQIIVPAEKAKMPEVPYKWNETGVDIMLENVELNETVKEKNITGFFRGINVESLSSGNITRIINAGFDSVSKIIKMSVNDFLKVEGFKEKMATKIYNGIREKMKEASLITLMSASNIFGRGFSEKRVELIMEVYPNILLSEETPAQKIRKISEIKGMAVKTAEAFVDKIASFIRFIEEINVSNKLILAEVNVNQNNETHSLFGKTIIMTGFRDAKIIGAIKRVGAKLGASVSKNTYMVIVKDKEENTSKIHDAKKMGITIMSAVEFLNMYMQ